VIAGSVHRGLFAVSWMGHEGYGLTFEQAQLAALLSILSCRTRSRRRCLQRQRGRA
jgi:hypothetical protein